MSDYTLLCGLFISLHLICNVSKVNEKVELWVYIAVLTALSALRGAEIGTDTNSYIAIFNECPMPLYDFGNSRYEVGYIWLNRILRSITDNYQILFIVSSFFVYYSFGRFIAKYSRNKWLSVYMFLCYGFYTTTFNLVRQGIAIGILLFAFDYIVSGRKLKFAILVLIAMMFHTTAIVFFFAYMARNIRFSVKLFAVVGLIGIIGVYLFSVILNLAFSYLPMYQRYGDSGYVGDAGLANMLYIFISAVILIYSYSILGNKKVKSNLTPMQSRVDNYSMVLVMFAFVLYILSMKANILDRVGIYFNVFTILLLPNAVKELKGEEKFIVYPILIITFYLYTMAIIMYRPLWNSVFPYSFCW